MWVRVPRLPLERTRGHGPTGRCQHRTLEIRVRLPVTPLDKYGPVVQRQRHLVHTQETMVRFHPGPLRLGRQPADHLGLEPGMRPPPTMLRIVPGRCPFDSHLSHCERLRTINGLVEQPGVFACLSLRRTLSLNTCQYGVYVNAKCTDFSSLASDAALFKHLHVQTKTPLVRKVEIRR